MDDVLLNTPVKKTAIPENLVFRHFPEFALFIKNNHLSAYTEELIRLSKEIDLPMLQYFKGMSDEQLIAMSLTAQEDFLSCASANKLSEYLDRSMATWQKDKLGIIRNDEVTAIDISLTGYIRKKALCKFLPLYTSAVDTVLDIVAEIDTYCITADVRATTIYEQLVKISLDQQALFTEALSNTTPGLNYVFDLGGRQLKYANKNCQAFFGYSLPELVAMGGGIMESVIHPDDMADTLANLERCAQSAFGDVISWEMRLKNAGGEYVWMRNYASLFSSSAENAAAEIVGIILDIAREKDTAQRLLQSEQLLLASQEQAGVGSFELDVATGRMNVTPQFKKIYEVSDFDLDTLVNNVHPDDRARINANRDVAIRDETLYDNEYRYIVNGKEKILWSRGAVSYKNNEKKLIGTVMDVTGRHELVRKLMRSEELFKEAQARTHIGNWTWDIKLDKVTWSDEMYRVYGLEPQSEEVNYDTYLRHIHPDDREERMRQVQHVFESGEPEERYYRIIMKDGSIRILHTKSDIEFDEAGNPARMTGTCQDVTEKQQLIDKLQQSDTLYKQAQALSHIGNWTRDLKTKALEWSDELYRIYELAPQSGDISDIARLYNHPEDEPLLAAAMRHSAATLQPFDVNYRIVMNSGKIKTLNAKGEVVADANGKAIRMYGTVQDITAQKLIERQLKDYQEFIEKITDVSPSVIAVYDVHTGQYSFINDAVEKLLGYSSTVVMEAGLPFMERLVHPDDLVFFKERQAHAIEAANALPANENEPIAEYKYRIINKAGEYRWLHTYSTIFERDGTEKVQSVLEVSVDITEQEAAEQTLQKKNLQLQQSNTSLEEYAYIASHDLKEPLRKIATFSDRLMVTQRDLLTDEGKLYFQKIIDASARMQNMIADLLSVATISGNKAFAHTDLNQVLAEALQALDHKIEEQKAIIEVAELPDAFVVASQFRQLFQNLINNSLKFAREGVTPHVRVSASYLSPQFGDKYGLAKAPKYLQLTVADNGIGFEPQYAQKIFAIFQRLHGRSEYEGTGIGLAVCKKIAENHDGTIFAEGAEGVGATFTIIIPVFK